MAKEKINSNGNIVESALSFDSKEHEYLGCIYQMRNGSYAQIIDYNGKFKVKIRFLDYTNYECVANLDNIKNGAVKNPYLLNAYGGYYGVGDYYPPKDPKPCKVWSAMLKRAAVHTDREAYYSCSVCDEWFDMQVFAKWYIEYRSRINPKYWNELEIDKDILQLGEKYKIYSPQTCCLVPQALNDMLINIDGNAFSKSSLPIGVIANGNHFTAYVSDRSKRYSVGTFVTPEEASDAYIKSKKEVVANAAKEYYSDGGITKEIYEVLQDIYIFPYMVK